MGVEAEAHDRAAGLLIEAGLGVGQVFAAELDVLVEKFLAAIGARNDVVSRGRSLGLGLRGRHGGMDQVEFEAGSLGNQLL